MNHANNEWRSSGLDGTRRRRMDGAAWLIASLLGVLVVPGQPGTRAGRGEAADVDLRIRFESWRLPLRQQGGRGTCSVFTLVGALEYAWAQQHDRGEPLSVEFLNWASNRATRNTADGGFFSDLWTGFEARGICPETDWPYRDTYEPEKEPGESVQSKAAEARRWGFRLHWIKPWDVRTGLTEAQFETIRRTLRDGWPVCAGLRWPKAERWENGVLQMASPDAVFDGHSVLVVGCRDDASQDGGGVLLIRNSGGGVKEGALPYAYARAYVNDAAWIEGTVRGKRSGEEH